MRQLLIGSPDLKKRPPVTKNFDTPKGKPRPAESYRYARRNMAHAQGQLPWAKPGTKL
jgi:hypothetical protein